LANFLSGSEQVGQTKDEAADGSAIYGDFLLFWLKDVKFDMRDGQRSCSWRRRRCWRRSRRQVNEYACACVCVCVLLCLHSPNEQLSFRLLNTLAGGKRSPHDADT